MNPTYSLDSDPYSFNFDDFKYKLYMGYAVGDSSAQVSMPLTYSVDHSIDVTEPSDQLDLEQFDQ